MEPTIGLLFLFFYTANAHLFAEASISVEPPPTRQLGPAQREPTPEEDGGLRVPYGVLEWAGANADVIHNFLSGPNPDGSAKNEPSPPLLGQLVQANVNFALNNVPRLLTQRMLARLSSPAAAPAGPIETAALPEHLERDDVSKRYPEGALIRNLVQALATDTAKKPSGNRTRPRRRQQEAHEDPTPSP